MNPIKSKDDFDECPISNILMKICDLEAEERCACDDVCAALCLPFGILIDFTCMCPRYGIYKCKKYKKVCSYKMYKKWIRSR